MKSFLTFASYEEAKRADATVCQFLRDRDGSKGSQWAGVSRRTDGTFGIFWDQPVFDALGLAANDTEVLDADGKSNWSDYTTPPDPVESGNVP